MTGGVLPPSLPPKNSDRDRQGLGPSPSHQRSWRFDVAKCWPRPRLKRVRAIVEDCTRKSSQNWRRPYKRDDRAPNCGDDHDNGHRQLSQRPI